MNEPRSGEDSPAGRASKYSDQEDYVFPQSGAACN